jgi:hypothetical protein
MKKYMIDLSKIDGCGEFPCPRCRVVISPEDFTEEKYSIIEPKVNGADLEEVELVCNICGSHIHLIGFSLLEEIAPVELSQRKCVLLNPAIST